MSPTHKNYGYLSGLLRIVGWVVVLIFLLTTVYLGTVMQKLEVFQGPINPMAIYSSPYGKLLSSLLQQPINTAWHKGIELHEEKNDHDHDHDQDPKRENAVKKEHAHHGEADHCEECDRAAGRLAIREDEGGALNSLSQEIDHLTKICTRRTNPNPISQGHKLYIAQDIEEKLLVAYNLDPTNYGAYDALFLFLTENPVSGLGGEHQLKQAEFITGHTLRVSTLEEINPLPSISAALATLNLFMLNFVHEKPKDVAYNRALYVKISEYLAKYQRLKGAAENNGDWEMVPEAWRVQADQRAALIANVAKGLVETPTDKSSK